MYFAGHIAIDPNAITEVTQPTKGFFRLAAQMSQGAADRKTQQECFTAVSILQRVNIALRSMGVTNIIHLSKDGYLVYEDKDGVEDDFKEALLEFGRNTDAEQRRNFRVLKLALEHPGDVLEYLIEIRIVKEPHVGEFPIQINVNGVYRNFAITGDQLSDEQRTLISDIFDNQSSHDAVQSAAETEFTNFLKQLESAFQVHMRVDNFHRESTTRVLKPKRKPTTFGRDGYRDPIFYSGYHWHGRTEYLPVWSDHYNESECKLSGCEVIDDEGRIIADIGEEHVSLEIDEETNTSESDRDLESAEGESSEGDAAECDSIEVFSEEEEKSAGWLSNLFGMGDTSNEGPSDCGGASDCGGDCGGD